MNPLSILVQLFKISLLITFLVVTSVSMITGGGKDGTLYEWNQDFERTGRSLKVPDSNGMVRFITCGKGQNLFLVGTTKNCIYQANFEMSYMNCLVNSHVEELWGVCSNPRESYFLTGGNDRNLFYWDALSHRLIWSAQLEDQVHSICIHPELDLGIYFHLFHLHCLFYLQN